MPCNVLLIQNDINSNATSYFTNNSLTIPHVIKNTLNINTEGLRNTYTHLILNIEEFEGIKTKLNQLNATPTLIITTKSIEQEQNVAKPPLNFDKIFTFISNTSNFSLNTLNEYALGEAEILNELTTQILAEFEASYQILPKLIKEKKLTEIKSIAHQISSKFSLLEMDEAYKLAKEIDTNILNNTDKQLNNCNKLLIDIAIVLDQLKN